MGVRLALGGDAVLELGKLGAPGSDMSSTGTTICRSSSFCRPASTISHSRLGPTRNFAIRSSGRCVAERPIRWTGRRGGLAEPPRCCSEGPPPTPTRCSSRSKRQRQVGAALGLGDGVDLVDDHRLDAGEDLAGAGGEDQVERLGGGDQDVGRRFAHRPALGLGRVAGAQARPRGRRRSPAAAPAGCARCRRRAPSAARRRRSARPGRAPAPARAGRCPRGRRPASCRSRSGRRSARWRRRRSPPAARLGGRRAREGGLEPAPDGGAERCQRVGFRARLTDRWPTHRSYADRWSCSAPGVSADLPPAKLT